jgi:hypothetical protein
MNRISKTHSIPTAALARLLELGADPELDRPEVVSDYADLREQHWINRLHWSEWFAATASLSMQELENLLKGLTIAELRFGWRDGSVASVIWVFKEIQRRSQVDADRLYEWVITRSTNPYAPTGSSVNPTIPHDMIPIIDRMTDEEREQWRQSFLESCRKLSEQRQTEKIARIEKAQKEAQNNRLAKANRKAQKRKLDSERREVRKRLIAKGLCLDAVGRLRLIVENSNIPLDFFPEDWARIPDEFCAAMTDEETSAVLSRIGKKRKGAWRDLSRRLGQRMR